MGIGTKPAKEAAHVHIRRQEEFSKISSRNQRLIGFLAPVL
ncbi:hypothetical protein AVDCRST_MAG81-3582 [uncultured Synechococcales cyanobacterium]|uniref:Uncharacterized protein n=1 Tax=uncultured Synechococcales cyanobacterium TaxID=1936017 RepID=A0A6J4VNE2_9CYAN|nr:hypothetical protein AVDCRST_MAG81-3582 [uncultured Synechococcales cyanobacterium]